MTNPAPLHILVTDKDHHVRDLLQRELREEGYVVWSESTPAGVDNSIRKNSTLDLMILDPEHFAPDHLDILQRGMDKTSTILVILHTYSDFFYLVNPGENIHCVAQKADSIDKMKDILRAYLPPDA